MDKKVKFTLRLTEEDLEIIESIKGDIGEVTTASAIRYIIRNYASLQIRFHRLIRQGKENESKFKFACDLLDAIENLKKYRGKE